MVTMIFEKNEAKKAELKDVFHKESLPKYLGKMDKLVGEDGYICLTLTWADLYLYCQLAILMEQGVSLDPYHSLRILQGNVEAIPAVVKWLKQRPTTPF